MIVWGGTVDHHNAAASTGGRYCAQSGPTPTPTPAPCSVTSAGCGSVVFVPPTDFTVNVSDPVDPVTVDASDFTVNGTPADNVVLSNGDTTISFISFIPRLRCRAPTLCILPLALLIVAGDRWSNSPARSVTRCRGLLRHQGLVLLQCRARSNNVD